MVAQEERVADPHQVNTRPVWSWGSGTVGVHAHAQEPPCTAPRPSLHGFQSGFLHQDFQCCCPALQTAWLVPLASGSLGLLALLFW